MILANQTVTCFRGGALRWSRTLRSEERMPATAADATRMQGAPEPAGPEPTVPGERDAPALDWPEVMRLLAATDEDDVPLFGRLPA
jgi:hypothetical protein